jgi:hypothetical protein
MLNTVSYVDIFTSYGTMLNTVSDADILTSYAWEHAEYNEWIFSLSLGTCRIQ